MNKQSLKEFQTESYIEVIKSLIEVNNGYITSKQLTELDIHRMYLKIMLDKNMILKVNKGVYIDKNIANDLFYTFQLRYPKTIYSGFTGLYLHGLINDFSKSFNITVDYNYHVDEVNKNHLVMKCDKKILTLGLTKIKTPQGHIVNVYDKERCICEIIKHKKRFDDDIIKVIRKYMKDSNKNIDRLLEYSKKMKIYDEIIKLCK